MSVQLAGWPEAADFVPALPQGEAAEAVMANFACLLEVRDAVTKAIEEARNENRWQEPGSRAEDYGFPGCRRRALARMMRPTSKNSSS